MPAPDVDAFRSELEGPDHLAATPVIGGESPSESEGATQWSSNDPGRKYVANPQRARAGTPAARRNATARRLKA